MAKITDYVEKTNPNGETDFFVIAYGGANYRVKMSNGAFWAERYRQKPAVTDLVGGSAVQVAPFTVFTNSLSVVQIASEDDHPGIWQISGSGAGDGAGFSLGIQNTLLGGETVEAVFRILPDMQWLAIGLLNFSNIGIVGPSDRGIYIGPSGSGTTVLQGQTWDGNINFSITPSSYTAAYNTWYRAKVVVSSNASRIDFYLYSENGDLLWSDSLTTNIPATVGPYIVIADAFGGSVLSADLDWLAVYNEKDLTR